MQPLTTKECESIKSGKNGFCKSFAHLWHFLSCYDNARFIAIVIYALVFWDASVDCTFLWPVNWNISISIQDRGARLWATDHYYQWNLAWSQGSSGCKDSHRNTKINVYPVCFEHIVLNGSYFLPGEHDVGVGVICAGACGAPLDRVYFFTVSLEVMDTGLLLHTPNLCVCAENGN